MRTVGERQYGQQQPSYGQQPAAPQQQGAYGQANTAAYQTPDNHGGAPGGRRSAPPAGGRRGPNTKGLLIGAIAVVAAVVIGISIAMINGNSDDDKSGNEAGTTPTQSQSTAPTTSSSATAAPGELPKIDAADKSVQLSGGAATASDVKGAEAAGGTYVGGLNAVGASVTWTVNDLPKGGKYTLNVGYGVPGKDANMTLTVNGTSLGRPLNMSNFARAAEGDREHGWTHTWSNIQLKQGSNTISISCAQGNQCDADLDTLWLEKGWR